MMFFDLSNQLQGLFYNSISLYIDYDISFKFYINLCNVNKITFINKNNNNNNIFLIQSLNMMPTEQK